MQASLRVGARTPGTTCTLWTPGARPGQHTPDDLVTISTQREPSNLTSCYRSGHSPEPYFVSRGRSYRVKLGTRVTFHCEASTLCDVSTRGHSELVTDKLAAWSLVTLDAPGRMGDDT